MATVQRTQPLGILVKTEDTKTLESFIDDHRIRYRAIYKKQGLYELYGVEPSLVADLKRLLPAALVTPNEKIQSQQMTSHSFLNWQNMQQTVYQILKNSLNETGFACNPRAPNPPLARIDLKGDETEEFQGGSAVLGGIVPLTASQSRPHTLASGGRIRALWHVQGPKFSHYSLAATQDPNASLTWGPELQIELDALGAYIVTLIVQDESGACAVRHAVLLSTANPTYTALNFQPVIPPEMFEQAFFHVAWIGARDVWNQTTGAGITIAVIDSGVNYNHPILNSNIAINTREIPGNGIDDDGNGFVDDYAGYDFVYDDPYPFDDEGHGSHVAGLAASPIGAAPLAAILPIKAMDALGTGDAGTMAAAVYYAVDRGVRIINASLGSTEQNPVLAQSIEYARRAEVLVVAAAGNGVPVPELGESRGVNIDIQPTFPAAYPHPNILSVAATNERGQLTTYSNFGVRSVDLAVIGGTREVPLWSAGVWNSVNELYAPSQGTSMAAPLVSGVAALVLSINRNLTAVQTKEVLLHSGPVLQHLDSAVGSNRVLQAQDAVELVLSSR